jgi:hypothetical protein
MPGADDRADRKGHDRHGDHRAGSPAAVLRVVLPAGLRSAGGPAGRGHRAHVFSTMRFSTSPNGRT